MTVSDSLAPYARIAIDSNVVIYSIEGQPGLRRLASDVLQHIVGKGLKAAICEIGVAECLYGAYKRGDETVAREYRRFLFDQQIVAMLPVTSRALIAAAINGPAFGLKLMDAIHVEVARQAACDCFITNDRAFQQVPGLAIIQLSSLSHG